MEKKIKPNLPMSHIISMNMGFLGIQMAFALQNGNASRILQNLGAEVDKLSYFWLVAPITGLIIQPIIGHMGDNTWGKFGRRKPYFFVGAVLCAIGIVMLPNAPTITHFFAANVLLIAVVFLAMMDLSVNIAMEPFRALVGDMLSSKQATVGFSVQTILIGIGAVVGSNLPIWLTSMGVANTAPEGFVAPNVIYSFYIGAIILLLTILYTIFSTKEYSPKQLAEFNGDSAVPDKTKFREIWKDLKNMPLTMKKLGVVQFFSWFALFTLWVYTTSALATHQYGLSPTDTASKAFNNAGDRTGYLFGLYNLFAVPFAFLLTPIAKRIGKNKTHAIALICGGLALISFMFVKDVHWLWISMIGLGFAWASILAMPYAMLIHNLPQHKMGVYMGIFNFFIVIPQILNGIIGGPIVKGFFHNYATDYIVIGGICMLLGAVVVYFIKEEGMHPEIEIPVYPPQDGDL